MPLIFSSSSEQSDPQPRQERVDEAVLRMGTLRETWELNTSVLLPGTHGPFSASAVLDLEVTVNELSGEFITVTIEGSNDQLEWFDLGTSTMSGQGFIAGTGTFHYAWLRATIAYDQLGDAADVSIRATTK